MIEGDELLNGLRSTGTTTVPVLNVLKELMSEGWDVLFDIDVQGGLQLKKRFPETDLPRAPIHGSLEKPIDPTRNRCARSNERRLEAAAQENETGLKDFDYIITNDQLDRALFDITAIVRAHRLRHMDREKIKQKLFGH